MTRRTRVSRFFVPLQQEMRKIIHIDMDAFFVSVEERDDPSLVGRPVAVGYDGPRGVVSTANYVARRYGVHSAQAIRTAHRLCPDLVVVMPHFDKYKAVSMQIRDIFHDYTDIIEPLSLDEAYLDVTDNKPGIELAVDIAREIKRRILAETRLTASAGVSYCKFLAKVGSDYRKPDGLCTIHPDRALDFIAGLKIERFWGVGEKTAARMHTLGIHTGADLRAKPLSLLTAHFGKMGEVFYNFARGIDERPVVTQWVRKSVGCERTYAQDIATLTDAITQLTHIVDELLGRLQRSGFEGTTLTLKVKYHDFVQITRSFTQEQVLRSKDQLMPMAMQLLREVDFSSRPVRLLGLTVSHPPRPARDSGTQQEPTLFDDENLVL